MSVLERARIIEVFLKKIYENFVGTLETVRNMEVSVLEGCPYQEVHLLIYLMDNAYLFIEKAASVLFLLSTLVTIGPSRESGIT